MGTPDPLATIPESKDNKEHNHLLPNLIDVHCHIQDTPTTLSHPFRLQKLMIMGTQPSDWPLVEQIHQSQPDRFVPCFGLHPWFATRQDDLEKVFTDLESYLQRNPTAILGECGLDKVATHPTTGELYDFSVQNEVFTRQMRLACKLNRPVSVHMVHAQGPLMDWVRIHCLGLVKGKKNVWDREKINANLPKRIMLHSYTGSPDIIRNLISLPKHYGERFYFSFSKFVNARTNRFRDVVAAVPDNRLLVESDMHSLDLVETDMLEIVKVVADIKGWSLEETAERTTQNALEFLSG